VFLSPDENVELNLLFFVAMDVNKKYKSDLPEANPNPVVCCQDDGSLVFANPAATVLANELSCKTIVELLPAEHDALIKACLENNSEMSARAKIGQRVFAWSYRRSRMGGKINIYGHEITLYVRDEINKPATEIPKIALNSLGMPLIVINDQLQVLFTNEAAGAIVEQSIGLVIRNGVLGSPFAKAVDSLKALFNAGLNGEDMLRLPYKPDGTELEVILLPMVDSVNPDGTSNAILYLYHKDLIDISIDSSLIKHYNLTVAEAKLANYLVKGLTLKECAEVFDLAMPTVRSQLSSIFKKTGTKRQSEVLVKILAGVVGHVAYLKR